MGRFRIYPKKSNTIANGFFEDFNSAYNPGVLLWYGGSSTRQSISRHLVEFDLTELEQKISSKEINPNFVSSYRLKYKNVVPSGELLDSDFEFAKLGKKIATSFDLIAFPINKFWDEGRGYDLIQTEFINISAGDTNLTGYSNWNSATQLVNWDNPGVYTNPTASTTTSTYSGNTSVSGLTFTQNLVSLPTVYGFNISGSTGFSFSVSATTTNNDTDILFNTLSGATTLDLKNELTGNTGFTSLSVDVNGGSSATTISSSQFFLSADTLTNEDRLWSTQHFDKGDEDIDMDITNIVNDWLSGGSQNYGIGIGYSKGFEEITGSTRYLSRFYSEKTNTAFKPYIEVVFDNQIIEDQRNVVANNKTSRIFLNLFSGNSSANYFSAGTVDIKNSAGTNIITGLTPTQLTKGSYYVDILMTGATKGQRYKDVWNEVTFQPGVDVQDFEQTFQIKGSFYTNTPRDVNEYVVETYGISNNEILKKGEVVRVYADARMEYSTKSPNTNYGLEYRITLNNTTEIIPWSKSNYMFIDNCTQFFFDVDTTWLLDSQNYQIELRVNDLGTKRVLPEKIYFSIAME